MTDLNARVIVDAEAQPVLDALNRLQLNVGSIPAKGRSQMRPITPASCAWSPTIPVELGGALRSELAGFDGIELTKNWASLDVNGHTLMMFLQIYAAEGQLWCPFCEWAYQTPPPGRSTSLTTIAARGTGPRCVRGAGTKER